MIIPGTQRSQSSSRKRVPDLATFRFLGLKCLIDPLSRLTTRRHFH